VPVLREDHPAAGAVAPISRGRAGPGLLAHLLFSKYGLHLPLNRQSNVYAREGIDLDVSTLADWVRPARSARPPRPDFASPILP
jgi:transposase